MGNDEDTRGGGGGEVGSIPGDSLLVPFPLARKQWRDTSRFRVIDSPSLSGIVESLHREEVPYIEGRVPQEEVYP